MFWIFITIVNISTLEDFFEFFFQIFFLKKKIEKKNNPQDIVSSRATMVYLLLLCLCCVSMCVLIKKFRLKNSYKNKPTRLRC